MSLAAQMLAASVEAQSRLAEIGGAAAGINNSLYNTAAYLAVYGTPFVDRRMKLGGGYQQRTVVPATATRGQFAAPPVADRQWVRTDMTPHLTYRIEKVDLHDPYLYVLTLIRVGE